MTAAQVAEWRKAIAELHAQQRRSRGRRNPDAWRSALPATIKQPLARQESIAVAPLLPNDVEEDR